MTALSTEWVETETIEQTSSVVTLGKTVENSLQSLQNQQLILIIPGRLYTHMNTVIKLGLQLNIIIRYG